MIEQCTSVMRTGPLAPEPGQILYRCSFPVGHEPITPWTDPAEPLAGQTYAHGDAVAESYWDA